MKFELGDRVIITDAEPYEQYRGKVGKIIQTDRIKNNLSLRWDYKVEFFEDIHDYVFAPSEMKKLPIKNQQLLFDFYKVN